MQKTRWAMTDVTLAVVAQLPSDLIDASARKHIVRSPILFSTDRSQTLVYTNIRISTSFSAYICKTSSRIRGGAPCGGLVCVSSIINSNKWAGSGKM